jgi:hypothetical protein
MLKSREIKVKLIEKQRVKLIEKQRVKLVEILYSKIIRKNLKGLK